MAVCETGSNGSCRRTRCTRAGIIRPARCGVVELLQGVAGVGREANRSWRAWVGGVDLEGEQPFQGRRST